MATIDVSGGGMFVSNNGKSTRADEIAYNPADGIFFITVPEADIPYAAFISTRARKVLGCHAFPEAVGGAQPAFSSLIKQFYIHVNGTTALNTSSSIRIRA